jgi:uncharacterized protein (TIGR03067 family)
MKPTIKRLIVAGLALAFLAVAVPMVRMAMEKARFQGVWRVVSAVDDGRVLPEKTTAGWLVKIDGYSVVIHEPEGKHPAKFDIEPSADPKRLTLTILEDPWRGDSWEGIYEIRDGRLRVCLPDMPAKPSPAGFASEKGSGLALVELMRLAD